MTHRSPKPPSDIGSPPPPDPRARTPHAGRRRSRWILATLTALASASVAADWWLALPEEATAHYVGRDTCARCHVRETEAWMGSHHDLAMDLASPETVLGDFDNAEITYQGVTSRMFRRDEQFFVHTEGPDGAMADFEVKYVIGVEPLQQYMVEFDDGRIQVLRISWDTERKRWFYLYPPDVKDERLRPDDPLHWTSYASNWNHMCAECHTTDLHKNYDTASDQYHTSFAEIDVSCETCHGPGSLHVQLAESKSLFWDRRRGYGLPALKSDDAKIQIESCAKCHMRRRRLVGPNFEPGGELLDSYEPALLRESLYHADGQVLDEVYVYGSFLQSKMHAKGIRCTDCHDPHTTRLKHDGNKLCTSCHQHPAGKYDVPAHHHHEPGTAGASCVECHMPATHYMLVDPRRDHSLRIPRPDLSVELGTPNACSACHLNTGLSDDWDHYADVLTAAREGDRRATKEIERTDRWCTEAVEKWYGPKDAKRRHYAHAFTAARRQQADAEELLTEVMQETEWPAIVRATAIEHLSNLDTPSSRSQVAKALSDREPLVRAAAVAGLYQRGDRSEQFARALTPLLDDPVRLVRVEAARVLAPAHRQLDRDARKAFHRALDEYRAGELGNRDLAATHFNLGNLASDLDDLPGAEEAYKTALRMDKNFVQARYNLGLLYSRRGEGRKAAEAFRALSEQQPDMASAHHRLGLSLAQMGRFDKSERSLLRAVELDPEHFDFLYTLCIFYLDRGDRTKALHYAQQLLARYPDEPRVRALVRDIGRLP